MNEQLLSIGHIVTPYETLEQCPSNVDDKYGPMCEIVIQEEYQQGLKGLKIEQRVDILYWLHDSLRSPNRPNPIGLAKLTIVEVKTDRILVRGLDCLNGSMLVDIKPSIA